MPRHPLQFDSLAVQTFVTGHDPLASASLAPISDEEQTRVNGCTVWTTCSPGCDSTVGTE